MNRNVSLTSDEALILLDWLMRHHEVDDLPHDDAEQKVLWKLESVLESVVTETFLADYDVVVDAAKKRILAE